jgi:hypothetical protein
VKRGEYQLNPRIAYNSNGDTQRDLLNELRAMQLKSKFPDKIGLLPDAQTDSES